MASRPSQEMRFEGGLRIRFRHLKITPLRGSRALPSDRSPAVSVFSAGTSAEATQAHPQPSTESLGAADIPPIGDGGANAQLPVARPLVLEVFPRERPKYAPYFRLGGASDISRTSF